MNVPENILSNRFDCPYSTATRCQQWQGWRFHKGVQHMNGHTALIYSRIRENRLDPAWTDFTRGQHQQAGDAGDAEQAREPVDVLPTAVRRQRASRADHDRPVDVGLPAARLGEVPRRATSPLPARRLGDAATAYITSTQENIQVVQEVLGNSAPQPPAPGSGLFGPGCVTGNQKFK